MENFEDFPGVTGIIEFIGSRDTTRVAFRNGLIENGEVWMDMVEKRNLTSHTYDAETAAEVVKIIREDYYTEFERLLIRLQQLMEDDGI